MRGSSTSQVVSAEDVARLVADYLDEAMALLGFRPVVHIGSVDALIPDAVAAAVIEAVDAALVDIHRRATAHSAIVSMDCRADAIELCVVDDGRGRRRAPTPPFAEATGVEHGVDDYQRYGVCQWWSIPLDLAS